MREFGNDGGRMVFGGMHADEIAGRFGTPVYVTDENILRENYRRIYGAFAKHMDTKVHYACKANSSLAILKILEQEGSCIDAVSIGEVRTCMKAGFPADRILYTGAAVGTAELEAVAALKVPVNVDSVSVLERLARIDVNNPISVRIVPGVGSGHCDKVVTGAEGSKFGVPADGVVNVYRRALELGFRPVGIHAHVGSGGYTAEPFMEVVNVLIDWTNRIKDELGLGLKFIDMGGGFKVPYKPNEPEMDVDDIATAVTDAILSETSVRTVCLEPGRYVVCDSTLLLTRCNDVKVSGSKHYICVDAGFNTLIRPAFYGSYHHVAIANKFDKACTGKYDVVGPICESGDFIARDRVLPSPEEGDVIAVYNCGAYSFSMSSMYNSRPLCSEVLVNKGKAELIRGPGTADDLWVHQTIPKRLL